MSANDVFALPVFFVILRESLETAIIVSILLAFVKQTLGPAEDPVTYKKLRKQIWLGTLLGLGICLAIGAGMIGAFYGLGTDTWAATENVWEGVFALIASIIITLMGAALLRVSKMREKWQAKLSKALAPRDTADTGPRAGAFKRWCEKYAMFLLPFITVLREGLEAIVFIGGVGVGLPASSFPLAVICGLAGGILIGYLIYRGGSYARIQIFLIISTCFLYLVAAGLFSKAVWLFEMNKWNQLVGGDAAEAGDGPGSYDIRQSVWHVNCCNPEIGGGGGWGVFNSLFGWQNSATLGSVLSYNLYWVVVIAMFVWMRLREGKKPAKASDLSEAKLSSSPSGSEENVEHTTVPTKGINETEDKVERA